MVEAIVQKRPASPADIASPAVYSDGIPHEGFAAIRGCEGLVWHPYEDNGFWAVTRHAEVREVSKNPVSSRRRSATPICGTLKLMPWRHGGH